MTTHQAAVFLGKGQAFETQYRSTPKPGPDDLLVAVKSVAMNPADGIMRELGLLVSSYPTVLGFDMSGLVLDIGENVPTNIANNAVSPCFRPGHTRVAGYGASVWKASEPDYGIFQECCLIPWQHVVILPDSISWNQAATLPVSVQVPLSAWDAMAIPRLGEATENKGQNEALLIWGASSSVGSMGVQTARLLRDDPNSACAAVYATAGSANLKYVRSLGADRVFDYKDSTVVESIISAARGDGLVIRHCFLAVGQFGQCQDVLKEFVRSDENGNMAKIASAPPVPADAEAITGVQPIFVTPSAVEVERLREFRYWFGTWLRENLAKGNVRPSPEPRVVGQGVAAINTAVDKIQQGVSCSKLIVEIAE